MKIFKGKQRGMVYLRPITLRQIWEVFFPTNFYQKYRYLGIVPYEEMGDMFKAVYPLALAMDYGAKPKWCPRWFLRFLHLFGNDNSIVRVRSYRLSRLKTRLTKGIMMYDIKTKWEWYDLRLSIAAPGHLQNLAHAIETEYYNNGYEEELVEAIKQLDPEASITRGSTKRLEKQLKKLEDESNT